MTLTNIIHLLLCTAIIYLFISLEEMKEPNNNPSHETFDHTKVTRLLAIADSDDPAGTKHVCAGGFVIAQQTALKRHFAYPLFDTETSLPLKCVDYRLETYLTNTHAQ